MKWSMSEIIFSVLHHVFSFGIGAHGRQYTWTSGADLMQLFTKYDRDFWYYVGENLPTKKQNDEIMGKWIWVVRDASHGHTTIQWNADQKTAIADFKKLIAMEYPFLFKSDLDSPFVSINLQ